MVEDLPAQREFPVHEIRFGERNARVLALGTVLDARTEFLTTTGEIGPVAHIKITLSNFREAQKAVH